MWLLTSSWGLSTPIYGDQQANETQGAGDQCFQGPMEVNLVKSMHFVFWYVMSFCEKDKEARATIADKNSLSGEKDKSRNLGMKNVKMLT